MGGSISIIQLVISTLLFFVMFFGIGFLINMLLRVTWFMAFLYPLIVVFIIDKVKMTDYIFKPKTAFPALWDNFISLKLADIIMLSGGLAGAIVAGIVMIILRKSGYRMF
ncbi:putative membrane protein YuiB [Lysinibacillus alkalisoli]|uniref:Membrane protein YuiB n=1 Tax=Lysinibacillus alkalisoli TaxID=1911548 RepID=A0A917LHT8_9BACI|nr:YuiB family protein [Lysinibacillus alkalisoli]GGG24633.1 putative membrane protein YuiB [Lysinibacillus alkalisoli]